MTDSVLVNHLFGYPGSDRLSFDQSAVWHQNSDGHSHCLVIQVVTDTVLVNQLFDNQGSNGYSI